MQTPLDLGDDHISTDELEADIASLQNQRDLINAQITAKKSTLHWVRSGATLECAHCGKEHPYRDLKFLVNERYSHTPAYEDAIYIPQDWGYECPSCRKQSWWARPVDSSVTNPEGVRRFFKTVHIIKER